MKSSERKIFNLTYLQMNNNYKPLESCKYKITNELSFQSHFSKNKVGILMVRCISLICHTNVVRAKELFMPRHILIIDYNDCTRDFYKYMRILKTSELENMSWGCLYSYFSIEFIKHTELYFQVPNVN